VVRSFAVTEKRCPICDNLFENCPAHTDKPEILSEEEIAKWREKFALGRIDFDLLDSHEALRAERGILQTPNSAPKWSG
jgi:hypothetical protein